MRTVTRAAKKSASEGRDIGSRSVAVRPPGRGGGPMSPRLHCSLGRRYPVGMGPSQKPQQQADNRPVLHVEDADGADDILDVDGEAYLQWLETGDGDPWGDSSD